MKKEKIITEIDVSKMGKDCYHDFKICLKKVFDCCELVIKGYHKLPDKSYEDLNDEDLKILQSYSDLLGELSGKLIGTDFLMKLAIIRHKKEVNNDNIEKTAK